MNVIRTITVDCADASVVGRFWETFLGWPLETEVDVDPALTEEIADSSAAFLTNPSAGPNLLFQRVPEGNRAELGIAERAA